jgi:hypothetical protein
MELVNVPLAKPIDLLAELCPECNRSASHITAIITKKQLLINTFRCPNGHRFSRKVKLKYIGG